MRREVFAHVLWDPDLKVAEHGEFFFRMLDALLGPLHPRRGGRSPVFQPSIDYARYRNRHKNFLSKAMAKHKLTKVETLTDGVIELPPDGDRPNPFWPPAPEALGLERAPDPTAPQRRDL